MRRLKYGVAGTSSCRRSFFTTVWGKLIAAAANGGVFSLLPVVVCISGGELPSDCSVGGELWRDDCSGEVCRLLLLDVGDIFSEDEGDRDWGVSQGRNSVGGCAACCLGVGSTAWSPHRGLVICLWGFKVENVGDSGVITPKHGILKSKIIFVQNIFQNIIRTIYNKIRNFRITNYGFFNKLLVKQ